VKQLRISFSGTHCAGKTTSIHGVASHLKQEGYESVQIVPEVARFCPFPINEESCFNTALWIVVHQMLWESQMKDAQVLLLDRCVLDEIGYALSAWKSGKMSGAEYGIISGIARKWNEWKPINLLLYFKPRILIPDGTRSLDDDWQMRIDAGITAIIGRFHVKKKRRVEYVGDQLDVRKVVKECIQIVTKEVFMWDVSREVEK